MVSHEDLVEFFNAIKARLGNLSPMMLMSDCANIIIMGWR